MTKEERFLIQVVGCGLRGDRVYEIPQDIDWRTFGRLAAFHQLDILVYDTVAEFHRCMPEDLLQYFKTRKRNAQLVDAVQAVETEVLQRKLAEAEISHLLLKGKILKDLYFKGEHRESADIDFLVREDDFEKAGEVMQAEGYHSNPRYEQHEVHKGFLKPPCMQIELHRKLVRSTGRAAALCERVWEYARPSGETPYTYVLAKEFCYVYIIAHLAKHLYNGGAGIRLVADIWAILKHWEMDEAEVKRLLHLAELEEIEAWSRALAEDWFGGVPCEDPTVLALGEFIVESGLFGTEKTRGKLHANMPRDEKWRSVAQAGFLPLSAMRIKYPVLVKHGYLLPVFWLYRLCTGLSLKKIKRGLLCRIGGGQTRDDQMKKIYDSVCDKGRITE